MHNFDLFIEKKLAEIVLEKNSHREGLTSNPVSRRYRQLDRKLTSTKKRIDTIYRQSGLSSVSEVKKSAFAKKFRDIKRAVEKYKSLKTRSRSVPGHLKKIRALYVRYADDWVIFTNLDRDTVEDIKVGIGSYLKAELGLTLSVDKTVLTDLSKGFAKFSDRYAF